MPIRVGVPLAKNNAIKRQNNNLVHAWFIDGSRAASNVRRKIYISTNNTISTVFDETEFTQGTTAGSSDVINILGQQTGSVSYFFRSDVQKWRLSTNRGGADQNDVVIPNKAIVTFLKILSGTDTVNLKGTARVGTYQ